MVEVGAYESKIGDDILRKRRGYFIKDVKAPLLNSILCMAGFTHKKRKFRWMPAKIYLLLDIWRIYRSVGRYPETTEDNAKSQNARVILGILNKIIPLVDDQSRVPLFQAAKKVLATTYEHDYFYAFWWDTFLAELVKAYQDGRWQLPLSGYPIIRGIDADAKTVEMDKKRDESRKWFESVLKKQGYMET